MKEFILSILSGIGLALFVWACLSSLYFLEAKEKHLEKSYFVDLIQNNNYSKNNNSQNEFKEKTERNEANTLDTIKIEFKPSFRGDGFNYNINPESLISGIPKINITSSHQKKHKLEVKSPFYWVYAPELYDQKAMEKVYPPQALQFGIEGKVVLEIKVASDGHVLGARVIDSTPEGIFDSAAVNMVKKWRGSREGVFIQPIIFKRM